MGHLEDIHLTVTNRKVWSYGHNLDQTVSLRLCRNAEHYKKKAKAQSWNMEDHTEEWTGSVPSNTQTALEDRQQWENNVVNVGRIVVDVGQMWCLHDMFRVVRVSVRVNSCRDSFSVFLRTQHYSILTVWHRITTPFILLSQRVDLLIAAIEYWLCVFVSVFSRYR